MPISILKNKIKTNKDIKKENKNLKSSKKVRFSISRIEKRKRRIGKEEVVPRYLTKIIGPYQKKYSLNKNRYCNSSKNINECLKNLRIRTETIKYLTSGSYGVVFRAKATDGTDIAIKMIIYIDTLKNKNNQMKLVEDLETEINYAAMMSDKDLGPKIYDTFYIIDHKEELDVNHPWAKKLVNSVAKIDPNIGFVKEMKKRNCIFNIQFLIMKAYEMDGNNALYDDNIDPVVKQQIVHQMVTLINKQVFELEIYCYDIKPSNFLVNINKSLDVKMIDFGTIYCRQDTIFYKPEKKYSIFSKFSKQELQGTVVMNNILQLYLLIYNLLYDIENQIDFAIITRFIFENQFGLHLFNGDYWRNFVNLYVDHCYEYIKKSGYYDAPMMLVGYSFDYFSSRPDLYKQSPQKTKEELYLKIQYGIDSYKLLMIN